MSFKADIGVIGAMAPEVDALVDSLEGRETVLVSGIEFHTGMLCDKRIAVARCGVGKVFSALCAEAMILCFHPELIVNTGVGGALDERLRPCDVVIADETLQYDMDTSALGDPVGLISGINMIYFRTDTRAVDILTEAAKRLGIKAYVGRVATGDKFVSTFEQKRRIALDFGALGCEMEGGAISHVAYVNSTPCVIIRAISDSLTGDGAIEYSEFLPRAAEASLRLTRELISEY